MHSIFGNAAATTKPQLLNSASPWATTKEDLAMLFKCAFTTAVTTRTTTLKGFHHNEAIHQHCFFDSASNKVQPASSPRSLYQAASTLNTLGYSPLRLDEYLAYIEDIVKSHGGSGDSNATKPFIVSVTGSAAEVVACAIQISTCSKNLNGYPMHMEVNLSCPNISGKPPPAYSKEALVEYLVALHDVRHQVAASIKFGIKTPPYTHAGQFQDIEDALVEMTVGGKNSCPVQFITATNTLGSCLVLSETNRELVTNKQTMKPVLKSVDGTGIGGMAGPSIHALSLGNVARLHQLLERHQELRGIEIIGVGGVADQLGYLRMRAAGANAVAIATAFGQQGIDIFEKIATGANDAAD